MPVRKPSPAFPPPLPPEPPAEPRKGEHATITAHDAWEDERVTDVECKLDGASFRSTRGDHLELTDCSMVEADLCETALTKSTLDGCDLRGSDFSKASVHGVRLGRSKLEGVRGSTSMRGVVVAGDQVIPLALNLFGDLGIEIQNEES
jgi:Pentapeptide repeats (9 copies)